MSASISITIRLGPLVSFEIVGENCRELSAALEGYEILNKQLDALCGDLAERVYPEGMETAEEKHAEDRA
ncbi:MAG: hypothetical protein WCP29_15730 [Acidobacteriota bacterium]